MSIQILYKAPTGITVKAVSVLASFCNYNAEKGKMHWEGENWVYEAKLPAGEYYYKFLINDSLLLNDPAANCYASRNGKEKELWSFLRVAWLGKRLFNNTQYSVTVEDYALSAMLADSGEPEKHKFNTTVDKKVVARFGFTGITGVHAVTVLWCDPAGSIKEYSEQMLLPEENKVSLWFWLDLKQQERREGRWIMKLYIDGNYVLEDGFWLENAFLYDRNGRIKQY